MTRAQQFRALAAVFDEFFDPALLETMTKYARGLRWSYGWRSNHDMAECIPHWNRTFAGRGRLNRQNIAPLLEEPVVSMWRAINTAFPDHVPVRAYCNAHTFGIEGYPHIDSREEGDCTAIVYLNPGWKRDWGGETILFDGNDAVQAISPYHGRLAIFDGRFTHKAGPVARTCSEVRMCLVFKTRPREPSENS